MLNSKSTVRDSSQHGMYNADDSNTSGDGGQYSKASYKQPAVTATSEPYAGIDLSRNAPKLQVTHILFYPLLLQTVLS